MTAPTSDGGASKTTGSHIRFPRVLLGTGAMLPTLDGLAPCDSLTIRPMGHLIFKICWKEWCDHLFYQDMVDSTRPSMELLYPYAITR